MQYISLQKELFDVGQELTRLSNGDNIGAISSFTGLVRADNNVKALEIEHHPVMTKNALQGLADDVMNQYDLYAVIIIHRYGKLVVGEPIVLCAASSAHREQSLRGIEFMIDRLKTDVPLWKKEFYEDETSEWLQQKQSDITSADKWKR